MTMPGTTISGIKISLLIASILGGVASLRYLRPNASPLERGIAFLCAVSGTYYSTPIILAYFGLTGDNIGSATAFTLGLFYIQLVDIVQRILAHYKDNPSKIITDIAKNIKK